MNIQATMKRYVEILHSTYQGQWGTSIEPNGNPKIMGVIQGRKGIYSYDILATFSGIEFYLYEGTNRIKLISKRNIRDSETERRFLRYIQSL